MPVDVDMFAYLSAFVTIVLALAVGDMVQSTHRLLRAGAKVAWDVRPIIAAAIVFLSVLSEFFSLWDVGVVRTFWFYELVGLMVTPTLVSLAALAVLPDEVPEGGLDLGEFYLTNRLYLFALLVLAVAADFIGNLREAWASTGGDIPLNDLLWWFVAPTAGAIILICVLLAWSTNRRVHLVGLASFLVIVLLAFSTWYIQLPSGAATTSVPTSDHRAFDIPTVVKADR